MGVNTNARDEAPREIRVEIGELALQGFRVDPERVSAAFEQELSRLVRAPGLSARRLGQELARAVHEGLSGHGEVTR